jgi:hypothetical protein
LEKLAQTWLLDSSFILYIRKYGYVLAEKKTTMDYAVCAIKTEFKRKINLSKMSHRKHGILTKGET